MRALTGMGLLSAAMLLLQVALTRFFSIAQFYHFAFLVISLALLGFGASGSLLALWPRLRRPSHGAGYALGFALSTVLAYLFVDHLPFDSYSIAWDAGQVVLLVGNLLALAVPFVFAGALIGALLSADAAHAGRTYAANLLGSAAGAILAPLVIAGLGSERSVLLCAALGAAAGLILAERRQVRLFSGAGCALAAALVIAFPAVFEVQPSPYKALSQFRLNPDATISVTRQNAYARLDVVVSPTIHAAQGLSLSYLGPLPPQTGLLVDGGELYPVAEAGPALEAIAHALPAAVAYALRPEGPTLVLGSGGNLDPWSALANTSGPVTVVEPNALVYDALAGDLGAYAGLADNPRVTLVQDEIRSYVERSRESFAVVHLALADNYRPITSGAFTLNENYTLTVEALQAYLRRAEPDGLLILTRWLQNPPSETPRVLALILAALGDVNARRHIVAYRSFQAMTFVVKPSPYTPEELQALLGEITRLRYDLVLAPVMPPDMINRYARLERPVYHGLFVALLEAPDRSAFYAGYDFAIDPPTDDQPFFFHFFRWRQTPEVLGNLGLRWQPFGGSGFFVLVALLIFVLGAGVLFVVLPVAVRPRFRAVLGLAGHLYALQVLGYFAALGLAYLLVEVALIQRYLLILGQPTLAVATVVGALLLWSGVASPFAGRVPWRWALLALALLLAAYPWISAALTPLLLPLPVIVRVGAVAGMIAPVGLLMGVPFARGIAALVDAPDLVPWAWALNGSASVVSAVLAVLLALTWGFTAVLLIGAGLYLLAAGLVAARSDLNSSRGRL